MESAMGEAGQGCAASRSLPVSVGFFEVICFC